MGARTSTITHLQGNLTSTHPHLRDGVDEVAQKALPNKTSPASLLPCKPSS